MERKAGGVKYEACGFWVLEVKSTQLEMGSMVHKKALVVLLAFFILSLVFTYPLPLHLGSAVEDRQDALLNVWITAWDGHQLLADPLHLFDANIFHPYPRTLAYSELLLGNALLALPLTAVTGNPVLGYNIALLLSFALSALGAYLLVLRLTRSPAAGFVAGLVFAFSSYRLTNLAQAQVTLDALVGSIDRPGGMTLPRNPKLPSFDALFPIPEELQEKLPGVRRERVDNYEERGPFVSPTTGNFATLPYGILNETPYPVKTALVRGYNPLSFPDHLTMVEAFKKLDFIVTCEIYPSEMAWLSDIVLPEPIWLEITGIGPRSYHSLYPQIAVRNAVVPQLHEEAKGFGGIILALAEAMGYGEYFRDTSENGSGNISGGKFNNLRLQSLGSSWSELLKSPTGLWEPADPEARQFVPREEFGTPSGKIEFYSTLLAENGYEPLPTWKPRREDPDDEFPFYMVISRAPMHKMTQTQNNVLALTGYPENSAVMNKAKAEEMGISDGDEVYVESRSGGWMERERKIKLKAKLIEGVRPDTVMIYHGFGRYSSYMTEAFGRGANEGDLVLSMDFNEMRRLNDPGMGAAMQDHAVKIYKA